MNNYVLILAGGGGTRLWPASRLKTPKQLLPLITKNSMLKDTILRTLPLVRFQNIFISTNKLQIQEVKKNLGPVPFSNIIEEPLKMDTAAAIGLATTIIFNKNPDAKIAVLPSDHHIEKEAEFRKLLGLGFKEAEKNQIVLLGIKPARPETGYGYIKVKSKIFPSENSSRNRKNQKSKIFKVERFVEKPDLETAKEYVKSGRYLWNAGMYIYKAKVMIAEFKRHLPNTYSKLLKIKDALGTRIERQTIKAEYKKTDKISVDFGVIEKAKNLAVISTDVGWSDIGSWTSLYEILIRQPAEKKLNENIVRHANFIQLDTKRCLVYGNEKGPTSKRLITAIGLSDLIIIDTPNALLVCPKNKAQEVKKLVERLNKKAEKNYL